MFFTIHLINMYFSFQNIVHTAKQMQYTLEKFLLDFLSDVLKWQKQRRQSDRSARLDERTD